MRTAYTISAVAHAGVLVWSIWSFAGKPIAADALPVDIISTSELSQMTAGHKSAPQAAAPKPLVEQVGDTKRVDDPNTKVAEKEVKAAREPKPEPPPPVEKPAEVKPDPIAEALAKEKAKPEPKPEPKQAAKTPTPPRKPTPPTPKYDPKQIAALLDKRDSTRVAAAGAALNNEPALGHESGQAAQLSQNEIDAFRRRVEECWSPPPGVNNTTKLNVIVRVLFKPDGSVARPPEVVSGPASPLGPAMAESAKRAILRCQPFKMLNPEHYEQWKDLEINFDPQLMIRG